MKLKNGLLAGYIGILTLSATTALADSHYLYVESNVAEAGGNSIFAFEALSDGTLSPLANSPFLTRGQGVADASFGLGPFDSDQNLITNPEHTLLFAVNSGSNTISVFHIEMDGSLTAVEGSPFASFGVDPVSLGYENGVLVVVNKHNDPAQSSDQSLPNYTSFRVSAAGALTHIDNSTVDVAAGSSPSQALLRQNLLFGADFLGGLLQSFKLNHGELEQNMPIALPESAFEGIAGPHAPLGLALHPSQSLLYVGLPTAGKIGVYKYNREGALQFLKTAPNSGQAVCWLRTNASGSRLYTSNSADHSISVYDTTNAQAPIEIQKLVVTSTGGLFQFSLDSSGSLLYVLEQRSAGSIPEGAGNAIHVLQIDSISGKVSELANQTFALELPGNTRPQGVATF